MDKTKNKKKRIVGIGLIAAIGLLAFAFAGFQVLAASGSGGGVVDQNAEGNGGEMTIAASAVTNSINYQGRLTDSAGNPLSGAYEMTFSLYEVPSGGTALDTDTHSVAVENGLFNTEIDFDQSYFDGRALWLGITVGADAEMTPRQELRPVPYALSLRPGAVINGSLSGPVLKVNTDGDDSYGVYAYTTGYDSEGFYAYTTGEDSEGFYAETFGDYSEGVNARTAGNGSEGVYARTTGKDSPAVYGYSKQDVGVYGKGKEGGYFTTTTAGTWDNLLAGVNVSTAYRSNPGVYVMTTGDLSDGVYTETTGNGSYGVCVKTAGEQSLGVSIENAGDYSDGFIVVTLGEGSRGVYSVTFGESSDGVYAYTKGDDSNGIVADTYGIRSDGVSVGTYGDYSKGVRIYTEGNGSDGVWLKTFGDNSDGIRASSAKGYGVYARGEKAGIYAKGSKYAADLQGKVIIRGYYTGNPVMELGEGLDYAEGFDVSDKNEIVPGTVLIIDPDNPGKLTIADKPYDTKVAGIVTGAKGQGSGVRLGSDQFDYDVALAGRVYCNVDATYGSIEPGDLLTTSPTPGYAMKATDYERAQGAILGKAMEMLEEGEKGQILVLVTLQ